VEVVNRAEHACLVNVTYVITATTPEGERHVREACSMDSKMSEWKRLIETSLSGRHVPKIVH
jgi:hypothetical protein